MRVRKELEVLRDLLSCLVKLEAMRAANDCRRYLNLTPAYATEEFKNLIKYVQGMENAIAAGKFIGFLKKVIDGKEQKN